ncbi:efflux transporter outer membrane subunit [Cognatitamlana onchidii]|uniref:efflux transporter outer membrane subunit n=1 Tax=Cognatitamlana onchidii TaxID=2562860 RepID=UPI0010A65328|nr:efflux transporter outer membrane subunit [Algibacter onchidii]
MKFLKLNSLGVFIVATLLLVLSCKVTEDYERAEQNLPEAFRQDFVKDSTIANLPWWKLFKDSVLVDLIQTTLEENQDLKIAISRIQESQLYVDISRADLYPQISYGAAANTSINSETKKANNSVSGVLNVSYTVDLWQRIKTMNDAALQNYLASEEAYKAITINLVAAMANAYISLRDLDNRLLISEKTAKSFEENLDVMKARFDAGFISEVDLTQANIQLIEAKTAVQTFNRSRVQLENAISVLLGSAPRDIPRGLSLFEQISLPEVPVGVPSELIDRRPDILQAEHVLHAQTLQIGVAETLRYPSLTLSANMGAEVLNPALIFADLGAQLFGPLFNYGKLKRGVEVEKQRTEQAFNQYQKIYLNAIKEVEDAMIAQETYRNEYELRNAQMELATKAANLSWVRYDGGLTSYLEVLALQNSQFSAELKASEALKQELSSIINLYQALGGGWHNQNNE